VVVNIQQNDEGRVRWRQDGGARDRTASLVVGQAIRARDYELAMQWLERSYQNHDYWLLFFNVDPENDPLRSDPRFQAMMKKLGVG